MLRPGPSRAKLYSIGVALLILIAGVVGSWQIFRPRYTFPRSERDYYQKDPILGHRHRPYALRVFPWPEHPSGKIVMRTNNLGMRSDRDLNLRKAEGYMRILIVGDSHLDGVVYNEESLATILERILNQISPERRFETLNVAAGYYGPDEYLACMTAYNHLDSDHLLVGLYSGNDYLDAARRIEGSAEGGISRPSSYKSKLLRAQKVHEGAVAQILNQAFYFKNFPHMKSLVLDRVERIFLEMHRKATLQKKTLSVLVIPTRWDVEQSAIGAEFFQAAEALGLVHEDLNMAGRMSLELTGRLVTQGIRIWTPSAETLQAYSPLFWKRDYHLNAAGHRLLAQLSASSLLTHLSPESNDPGRVSQE